MSRSPWKAARLDTSPQLLRPEDVPKLANDWRHKYSREDVRAFLIDRPGRSVWNAGSGEYAITSTWRNRPEISQIVELDAPANPAALLAALVHHCEQAGDELVILIESFEQRRPHVFRDSGMEVLEEVVAMETVEVHPHQSNSGASLVQVRELDAVSLDRLIEIDAAAFPWIWRNSPAEFRVYHANPEVEINLLVHDGHSIGYAGATMQAGWAHIDRLAIDPPWQGKGFGADLLDGTLQRLRSLGVRKVALSTQADNHRSQRLYEGFGFTFTPAHDYRIVGRYLNRIEENAN